MPKWARWGAVFPRKGPPYLARAPVSNCLITDPKPTLNSKLHTSIICRNMGWKAGGQATRELSETLTDACKV